MPKQTLEAVDLFCGAGGTSTGLKSACERLGIPMRLTAVNHWSLAIDTHSANHVDSEHLCADLESVDPHVVVPSGRLKILVASPECTHHSIARGGKPMNNQKRASAMYILNWASKLYIENILIENVREWRDWGPLNALGRPIQAKKGQLFLHFVEALKIMDYVVEWKVLNAADYGAPTTRERFFLQAKKKWRGVRITWPDPSHKKPGSKDQVTLFGDTRKPWRTAREIIDWNIESRSIFNRKKPLASTTINRIMAGFAKKGKAGEPFIIALRNHVAPRGVDEPIHTVTAGGNQIGIGQAIILGQQSGSVARDVDRPLPTVATDGAISLTEGIVIPLQRKQNCTHLNEPIPTVTATSSDFGLASGEVRKVETIVPFFGERDGQNPRSHSLDEPVPTITGQGAGAVAEGFIVTVAHGTKEGDSEHRRSNGLDTPLGTVVGSNCFGIVEGSFITTAGGAEGQGRQANHMNEPLGTVLTNDRRAVVEGQAFIAPTNHGSCDRSYGLERPMPTVTAFDAFGFVEGQAAAVNNEEETEFLAKYYGTATDASIDEPLDTVTARDRFGLVEGRWVEVTTGDGTKYLVDIRFRMLAPKELALAQSFPANYKFTGNREDVVKQIGNAVPPALAESLIFEMLRPRADGLRNPTEELAA